MYLGFESEIHLNNRMRGLQKGAAVEVFRKTKHSKTFAQAVRTRVTITSHEDVPGSV